MPDAVTLPPMDEYNRTLVEHVHPADWQNPKPAGRYNLVVVGAGTAGLVTSAIAAGLGAKVALVERHLMGGDCLNVGCVPSKALIASARRVHACRAAGEYGVRVDDVAVDFPAIMERMRRLRAGISHHDSAKRFRDLGVDVFLGDARFNGSDTLQVAGRVLPFRKAVIATGARAAELPIEGLAAAGCLTNETVFSLTELPARLAVIGAGPIGCELAQCFARFGSKVSQFERGERILSKEDPEAAQIVEASLQRDGVDLLTGTTLRSVRAAGSVKTICYERGGTTRQLEVDAILLGVGRTPNTDGLNLEAMGVRLDEGRGIVVDDFLRTTNPNFLAAGDVCSRYKFTHAADFMARAVVQNALFKVGPFLGARVSDLTIPWCTYTDPEIAHVGLYEHEARERGIAIDTFQQPLSGVDRAILDGETEGFVKVHVKRGSDRILGATIVASHAGDLISEVSAAMRAKLGLKGLAGTIHPYPTQAEAIRKTGDLYGRTRLTPFVARLFERWLAWRR